MKIAKWVAFGVAYITLTGCSVSPEVLTDKVVNIDVENATLHGTSAITNMTEDALTAADLVKKQNYIYNTEEMTRSIASLAAENVVSNINYFSKNLVNTCKMGVYGTSGLSLIQPKSKDEPRVIITYFQHDDFKKFIHDDWSAASKCITGMNEMIDKRIDFRYHRSTSRFFTIAKSFKDTLRFVEDDINQTRLLAGKAAPQDAVVSSTVFTSKEDQELAASIKELEASVSNAPVVDTLPPTSNTSVPSQVIDEDIIF